MAAPAKKNDYYSIIRDIRKGNYSGVYFLMGDEPYFIDLITNELIINIFPSEEGRDFDLHILYGKDSGINEAIMFARQFPMVSKYKVVVFKEAQEALNLKGLELYFKVLQPSTIFIINYKNKSIDKRTKLYGLLKDNAVVYESKKLWDSEIPGWIKSYLSLNKISIDDKSTQLLADFLGNDLSRIVNELHKLQITTGGINNITPEIIEKNIGISKDYNDFELIDAVVSKDIKKANQIALYFSKDPRSNSIIRTISNFYSFFSNLMCYYYIVDKESQNVCSLLHIKYFYYKNIVLASKSYSAAKTMKIIHTLREYDAGAKGYNFVASSDYEKLRELIFIIMN